ncbi:hypothetical protein KIF53_21775 [Chromobacterium subtsugae]|uniref:Uncharacterized protein n=1 Tax=Chromobacterium subtsugae TaxID=251747 RepID=A0ABS7FJK5_9NEIS|nr:MULTISPECIES: hypothetical protein [Chromobacterium]MBW7569182.1 hypothetical protein [Chromobacterium subtsugae]MBW8290271.1 hypothetical protein [Chromobacterium subtsugae]WSE92323.1 hypothetical protein U6115_03475 [Chromobacterium subtsugae]WVH60701.1 hypothetical protein U6151_03495 [Chromobacterium subtsugae]
MTIVPWPRFIPYPQGKDLMLSLATNLQEILAQSALLSLLLERCCAVLFDPPRQKQHSLKLPDTLHIPLPRGAKLRLPLADAGCLAAAYALCAQLPIHLIANMRPNLLPEQADALISAAFITGLAQLWRHAGQRLQPAATPLPSKVLSLAGSELPASPQQAAPLRRAFRLGALQSDEQPANTQSSIRS